MNEYFDARKKKLEQNGFKYPDSFSVTHKAIEMQHLADGTQTRGAGRIMLKREMGKIAFMQIKDYSGAIQVALRDDQLKGQFNFLCENLDLGDIVGFAGKMFVTKKGEKTVDIEEMHLLSKCYFPLPEKWHGLVDDEQKLRKRYLDLLVNEESQKKFALRHKMISTIRTYMERYEFIEVETPILQSMPSGALAKPFKTHHNALDIPLYLRIAPETYLKRLMAGGYERVFEIGKSFRNEGVDASHLQEFTMMEFYCAYWNYENAIEYTRNMFAEIFEKLQLPLTLEYEGQQVNWGGTWQRIKYRDLVYKYTGLDLNELLKDERELIEAAKKFVDVSQLRSAASVIDAIYKKHCRPNLIDPCIVTNQPAVLGPLARANDVEPLWSDRFQVVVCGHEIVNAYSELVDPVRQREILEWQAQLIEQGEEEAMAMEEDFLQAMSYAMPPMAGVGVGLDRVIALLTNSKSLRDIVFFPNLR